VEVSIEDPPSNSASPLSLMTTRRYRRLGCGALSTTFVLQARALAGNLAFLLRA
jgi:hypothetical protein